MTDLERQLGGLPSQQLVTFSVHKLFTCDDASGTFELRLNGIRSAERCTARWLITGGDGAYANLMGEGSFNRVDQEEGTVQDTYLGQINIR